MFFRVIWFWYIFSSACGNLQCWKRQKRRSVRAESRKSNLNLLLCAGGDSNPHALAGYATSRRNVYQFQHLRTTLSSTSIRVLLDETYFTCFSAEFQFPPLSARSLHAHPPPLRLRASVLPPGNRPLCGSCAIAGALRAKPFRECSRASLFARDFS